jgi:hypothetical protein
LRSQKVFRQGFSPLYVYVFVLDSIANTDAHCKRRLASERSRQRWKRRQYRAYISLTRRRRSTRILAPSPCGELFETDASKPLDQAEPSGSTRMSSTGSWSREGDE